MRKSSVLAAVMAALVWPVVPTLAMEPFDEVMPRLDLGSEVWDAVGEIRSRYWQELEDLTRAEDQAAGRSFQLMLVGASPEERAEAQAQWEQARAAREQVMARRNREIRAALPFGQRSRYDLGLRLIAEREAGCEAVAAEFAQRRREGELTPEQEAEFMAREQAIRDGYERRLDEDVGPVITKAAQ